MSRGRRLQLQFRMWVKGAVQPSGKPGLLPGTQGAGTSCEHPTECSSVQAASPTNSLFTKVPLFMTEETFRLNRGSIACKQ